MGHFVETWVSASAEELEFLDRHSIHPEPGERVEIPLAAQHHMSVSGLFGARVCGRDRLRVYARRATCGTASRDDQSDPPTFGKRESIRSSGRAGHYCGRELHGACGGRGETRDAVRRSWSRNRNSCWALARRMNLPTPSKIAACRRSGRKSLCNSSIWSLLRGWARAFMCWWRARESQRDESKRWRV